MDQFASVFGKEGKLMRLDCNSREFEYFPFEPKGYKLCLVNSKVKHELAGSPYNDRRNSCENVVKHIAAKHPEAKFETLRDCTWEQLEEVRAEVGEEDYSRAHFVLGEKDRVLAVCDALEKGDYETVGQKMYETHYGLSKEYEVSCEELDFLNDVAKENGVTVASALVKARTEKPILTTKDFMAAVEPLFKREREKKDMAKLFQALRIEVNHEMDALKEMLRSATDLLKPGGRLSVITYHSLEDRIVKNMMKAGNAEGKIEQDFFGRIETPFKLVNNKVIVPDADEQERNPRSRSAKLRIAEKK